jgi:hypothetical protein
MMKQDPKSAKGSDGGADAEMSAITPILEMTSVTNFTTRNLTKLSAS